MVLAVVASCFRGRDVGLEYLGILFLNTYAFLPMYILSFLQIKGILSRNNIFEIMQIGLLQSTLAVRKYLIQVKNMDSRYELQLCHLLSGGY